jgi:hypothetical protein
MNLEFGKRDALVMLTMGNPVIVKDCATRTAIGLGYAVASGWAIHDGDDYYRITEAGQKKLADYQANKLASTYDY